MSHLLIEKKNHRLTVTMNRPEVRNAFNDAMISEMTKCFKSIADEKDIRVVVLRGAGESFSSGGDLNWMKSMVNYTEEENIQDSEKLFDMYQSLTEIPVPVLCLTHGHSMGGGLGLMAASDICLGVNGTQYCFSEVRLGLAPAVISSFVGKKMHPADIARYFLTAEVFGPAQAQKVGLIQEFGSSNEMEILLDKLTKKIGNNGPEAIKATKSLVKELNALVNPKQKTTELIAKLRVSDEGQEGLKSFFEKRKPKWLGQQ